MMAASITARCGVGRLASIIIRQTLSGSFGPGKGILHPAQDAGPTDSIASGWGRHALGDFPFIDVAGRGRGPCPVMEGPDFLPGQSPIVVGVRLIESLFDEGQRPVALRHGRRLYNAIRLIVLGFRVGCSSGPFGRDRGAALRRRPSETYALGPAGTNDPLRGRWNCSASQAPSRGGRTARPSGTFVRVAWPAPPSAPL